MFSETTLSGHFISLTSDCSIRVFQSFSSVQVQKVQNKHILLIDMIPSYQHWLFPSSKFINVTDLHGM